MHVETAFYYYHRKLVSRKSTGLNEFDGAPHHSCEIGVMSYTGNLIGKLLNESDHLYLKVIAIRLRNGLDDGIFKYMHAYHNTTILQAIKKCNMKQKRTYELQLFFNGNGESTLLLPRMSF